MSAAPDDSNPPRPTNRLAGEKSPYLLQHAHNPVDWFPWGSEAFEKARRENKPVFLSVGYSACHWCHVMERESFEDEAIGRLLNERFVSIKVDREERPDVDEIYMTGVQLLTGHGGWPMSVFLLPDGRPFYGGTYFPPEGRQGRPGFGSLVTQLSEAFQTRLVEIEQVAQNLTEEIGRATRQRPLSAPAERIDPDALLTHALADGQTRFDAKNGGFGPAPKFPPHHSLRLLLAALDAGHENAAPLLTLSLDKMALGGLYDHVGGGFHRYATDAVWLLPHFEKMLYDNALLARVYAGAFGATGRAAYARVARETCDWVLRDLRDENGGFHAALDADSEGEEGKYYVWTLAQVREILGDKAGAAWAARYNILPGGNFRDEATGQPAGTNIPHLAVGPTRIELPPAIAPTYADARAALLAVRDKRVAPGKDDKVITAWNGLMIGALAYAGSVLDEPRYLDAARQAADFCLTTLRPGGQLLRRFARGEAALPAFLDDHAYLADGLLDLFEATNEGRWADHARLLADTLLDRFWDDEDNGFFFAGVGHERLIAASKDLFDGALPSANGVAARVLARLGNQPGGERYASKARALLATYHSVMERAPQGTQTLILAAGDAFPGGAATLAAPGAAAPDTGPVTLEADRRCVLAVSPGDVVEITFSLEIAPGHHVNANPAGNESLVPTVATISTNLPATVGPVVYPEAVPWSANESSANKNTQLPTYQGIARFTVPLTLAQNVGPGRYRVALSVGFQACTAFECLPPGEREAIQIVEVR